MKNKKNKKVAGAVLSLATASVLLAGGTLAWYVVSNTANATIEATAASAQDMQVGVKSANLSVTGTTVDDTMTEVFWVDNYNTTEVEAEQTAAQTVFNQAISAAIAANRTDGRQTLMPVTTGAYTDGDDIDLFKQPTELNITGNTVADQDDYIQFTLTFKTVGGSKGIYFNRAAMDFGYQGTTAANEAERNMISALRIGVEDATGGTNTIFAPISAADDVTTNVGGALDLNGDGVYDYRVVQAVPQGGTDAVAQNQEIYYGHLADEAADVAYETVTTANQTGSNYKVPVPNSNRNCFTAAHVTTQEATLYGLDLQQVAAGNVAATQAAHGMGYYDYESDGSNNHPIAISDTDGYAEITFKIWLEGWDRACTNSIIETTISSTLAFYSPGQDVVAE